MGWSDTKIVAPMAPRRPRSAPMTPRSISPWVQPTCISAYRPHRGGGGSEGRRRAGARGPCARRLAVPGTRPGLGPCAGPALHAGSGPGAGDRSPGAGARRLAPPTAAPSVTQARSPAVDKAVNAFSRSPPTLAEPHGWSLVIRNSIERSAHVRAQETNLGRKRGATQMIATGRCEAQAKTAWRGVRSQCSCCLIRTYRAGIGRTSHMLPKSPFEPRFDGQLYAAQTIL